MKLSLRVWIVSCLLVVCPPLMASSRLIWVYRDGCSACEFMKVHVFSQFSSLQIRYPLLSSYQLEAYNLANYFDRMKFEAMLSAQSFVSQKSYSGRVPFVAILGAGRMSGLGYCTLTGPVSPLYMVQWLEERILLC